MKTKGSKKSGSPTDFSQLCNEELAEALIFPTVEPVTTAEKQEEEEFWQERRKQFENHTAGQDLFPHKIAY